MSNHEHTAKLFPLPTSKKKPKGLNEVILSNYRERHLEAMREMTRERVNARRQSLHATLAAFILFGGLIFVIGDAAAKRAQVAEVCKAFKEEMAR